MLTVPELLMDVIQAFKIRVPGLNRMGRDFRVDSLKLGQTYTAHIAGVPAVSDYDENNGGYEANATDARSLLTAVPIVVDKHRKVSLSWRHLDQIADQKNEYDKVIANTGYALAKSVVLDVVGKANSRTLSQNTIALAANSDYDVVDAIRGKMNLAGASPFGRAGLVNTDVAAAMHLDNRILSADYRGEMGGADAYRIFRNIAGFEEVAEWPEMPTNHGAVTALTTVTNGSDLFTLAAHGLEDGDRVQFTGTALPAGLTAATDYYVRDAATNTFKVSATSGGAVVNITDDGTAVSFQRREYLSGLFFEPRALAVLAGIPDDTTDLANKLGIPQVVGIEVVTDPDTGLTMMGITSQKQGTLNLFLHVTMVWGSAVGKQLSTNAAGSLTDYAGHRLITQ